MDALSFVLVSCMALSQTIAAFVPANVRMPYISNNVIPYKENGINLMDDAMMERLNGITRSYDALTERLGDPDVIEDSNLLMKVMSDRSKSEEVVLAFQKVWTVDYFNFTCVCVSHF